MRKQSVKFIISVLLSLAPTFVLAVSDIGFGTLKGIKIYETNNVTKIYFSDNATQKDLALCNGVAELTHSKHAPELLDRIFSIALSAYVSGKKVRITSFTDTCEADFIAIQESYF